jgi:hypothetical protein
MNDLCVATAYGSVQRPHTVDVHVLDHRSSLHEQLKADKNSLKCPVHLHTSIMQVSSRRPQACLAELVCNFPVSSDEFHDTVLNRPELVLLYCQLLTIHDTLPHHLHYIIFPVQTA